MKSKGFRLISLAALPVFFCLSSCVSTETMEPEIPQESSQRIIIDLTPELDVSTRAAADHSGHKLRFIGKLYHKYSDSFRDDIFVRKELILGDQAEDADKINQLVFDVPAGNKYGIFLYADYIPSSATKNSAGEYGDYYYDTHTDKERIAMYATPKTSFSNLSAEFFNNDNYDLFHAYFEVDKTPEKVEEDIVLHRCVAKVRFVDTEGVSGNYSLSTTNFKYFRYLSTSSAELIGAGGETTPSANINVYSQKGVTSDENNESEFLFYYTFSNPDSSGQFNNYIIFTVTSEKGESKSFTVTDIPTRRNYITTVKSSFLPDDSKSGDGGGDNPGPEDNLGPIILNLSVSSADWEHQTKIWN